VKTRTVGEKVRKEKKKKDEKVDEVREAEGAAFGDLRDTIRYGYVLLYSTVV
jgi:hypothetical protein